MGKRYRFAFKRLDVYGVAVEHFQWTCDVVRRMPKGPFRVVDQAIGSSLSVMGNIGEAYGRESRYGEAEQHYRYAQGSAFEAATHLDAFSALGVIDDAEYDAAEERLARVGMMLTRLMQKQRRRAREGRRPHRQRRQVTPAVRGETEPPAGGVPSAAGEVGDPLASGSARRPPNPRAAGPAERSDGRSESPPRGVPEGAKRPTGIESRPAGRRGSEATEGDRTPYPDTDEP